ncbi:MAG: hypothetical protein KIS76_15850 [Pyrinomonadaceae bacterium]|nr:hypothetical protein [Pyrinomonadaceae bacterium]
MLNAKPFVSFIVLISIYVGMIAPFGISAQQISGRTVKLKDMENLPNGLTFRLSEGEEGAENRAKTPPANAEALSPDQTSELLKRIPPIKSTDEDKTDFAKRAGTLPPPKTGTKIPVKFPSDEEQRGTPKVNLGDKLEVLRYSPEGELGLAPDLSVTFSHPMVAVSSQEEAAQTVPIQLSPASEGKWRWLGTKTLMFDTTKRFPMATKFTARVPAGTRSVTGQTLDKDVTWTFTTPPPKVEQMIPLNQTTRRDAVMFVTFDQAINPAEVIKTISVTSKGKKIPIRLATEEESKAFSYYIQNTQPNRWIAFRAVNADGGTQNALPADSPITVTIEKGTASAEGPLKTENAQSFSFKTFGAMKFIRAVCGYQGKKDCSPFDNWWIEFTNQIDSTKFDPSMITVEPAIERLNISPGGNGLSIQGIKKGNTTYKISISDEILDVYGQKLQEPATATIKVGNAPLSLFSQGGNFVVLDPTAKPSYSIYSTNHKSVKLKIYRVQPQDWHAFQEYVRRINYDDSTARPSIPGNLVVDKTLSIDNKIDEMVETRIDLTGALSNNLGNLIIDVEPTVKRDKYDRTRVFVWAQATQIGLDAFVDNSELVGFATDLKNGKALDGVEMTIYPNGKAVSSQQSTVNSDYSLESWWLWLTSFGRADPSEVRSVDENGNEAETETIEPAQTNRTTDNGILRLPLPDNSSDRQNLLIAKRGNDVAFLPENSDYYWQQAGNWYKKSDYTTLRWFVFDDRKMYRPKEEVSVKGYIRIYESGKLGDVQPLGDGASGLTFSVKDAQNNEIAKGTANLNAFGAFDFKFKIPDNANLGYSRIDLSTTSSLGGDQTSHSFQIQEFRRPEFEVTSKVETEAPHFVGDSAKVSVEAKYYAGGGLANADVNWNVTATPTNYTPPNRDEYIFGTWTPWWYRGYNNYYGGNTQNFKGVTDAGGKHILKIDFESVKPPRPYNIVASSSVQDVNRQTWSSSTSLLVHPSDLYVGIRSPRTFVQKGEPINVESIVSTIGGALVSGRDIEIKAVLKDWVFEKGSWSEKTIYEQTCNIKSADKGVICKFVAKAGGRYTIKANVMDDRERFNESEFTVWVAGGKTVPKRNVEMEEAQIIPSQKDFKPGDVAELLVLSPFTPAEGVLTLRRDGIVKTERFSMKDSSIILKIPLEEKYLPNIHAQVDLVGAAPRTDDKGEVNEKLAKRPAYASGSIDLPISTATRELDVKAEPKDKTLEPGGSTKIDVAVTDKNGEPVTNTEVAVVVVDESVLALSAYKLANPLDIFYTKRSEGVTDYHLRKDILLGNPDDVSPPSPEELPKGTNFSSDLMMAEGAAPAPMMARSVAKKSASERDESPQQQEQINLRENFNALAVFAPSVKTNSSGKATVDVKLPDNLTRYRVMAVAVDTGKRFGKGESSITARQPLMVRPSAPRFMNFGDKIELPVVVQNQTDQPMSVNVAVRATNANLTNGGGRKVNVPANDRVELRFPVDADKAGTARFQFAVTSGKHSDAAEISLPVWTPATSEAFATYGTTDQNGAIVQPVQAPADVFPQFGGLEVTTSSTQLQELTDAFIYLYNYRFECTEQITSRMISVAALQDVLTAFKAKEMPSEAELKARFAKDVDILKSRQNSNGYFGLWKRDGERYKYPFVTVHAAHALFLAKQKGYTVPQEMLDKTKPYLKNIESHLDDQWYRNSPQVRWTISAYALYVRNLMGDNDAAKAKKLLTEATIEKMPFEGLGWIMSVLADDKNSAAEVEQIKRFVMNRTSETAATAQFNTDYGDGEWLIMYSNRRADGVLLEAFLKADPNNDLVPKLVRGLLDNRTKGRWGNTQENVFILLALDKYFNAYEKVTPDFVTRIWLGGTYAGEQIFKGRSIDSNQLTIPMNYLIEQGGASNLIFDKQGAGRLYYRIGMNYAPKNLNLKPADYGFTVLRTYEAVDKPEDVRQEADGKWVFAAGSRVRVRLTMVAQARRYHVALVDPLPAGLEILNPGLAVTEDIPRDNGNTPVVEYGSKGYGFGSYYWRQYWFEHQNFRDERAEAFSALVWGGVYNYTYVTRATTPGQFVVPPAKAEEMYHPETFGRTGTDFVTIK